MGRVGAAAAESQFLVPGRRARALVAAEGAIEAVVLLRRCRPSGGLLELLSRVGVFALRWSIYSPRSRPGVSRGQPWRGGRSSCHLLFVSFWSYHTGNVIMLLIVIGAMMLIYHFMNMFVSCCPSSGVRMK